MPRKKKGACKKTVKEKPIAVNDNEEAFLNFVDKNARQGIDLANIVDRNSRRSSAINNPNFTDQNARKSSGLKNPNLVDENAKQGTGFCDLAAIGFQFDSGSESSASSEASLGRSGGQFCVSGSSGESAYDKGGQKSTRKHDRPSKTGKESKNGAYMQGSSSNVMNASSSNKKQPQILLQDPRYSRDELKACFAVVKKIMEMKEATSFNSPVDPAVLGIPDYFDVIDTPMDFGTICNNLRNELKYANAEDVYKDVSHIWDNCLKYNKKGDYIVYLMKRVKKKFLGYWSAAGLQCDFPGKTTGHSHLETFNDHAMRHSQHDGISMVNRMVGSVRQVQQEDHEPESNVLLPTCSNPYQSHHSRPHKRTIQEQRFSHLQENCNSQGNSHLAYSNEHYKKQKKHDSISLVNHMAGSQMQHGNFGTIHPQSQVPLTSYNQPYQSHQPQPSTTQPLEPSQFQSGTNLEHNCLVPSSTCAMRHSKRSSISTTNLAVGTEARQDDCGTHRTQPQVPQSSYNQPYLLHQPHPYATQPPLVSPSQDCTYSNHAVLAGHSNLPPPVHQYTMKRKKHETRNSVVPFMSSLVHSKLQQPQLSQCHVQPSEQRKFHQHPYRSHAVTDIDNAGHPHILPSMNCSIEHDYSATRCPVGPIFVNQSEQKLHQLLQNHNHPSGSCQCRTGFEQPQTSQPLPSADISSAACENASKMGNISAQTSSTGLDPEIPLVSSHSLSQQSSKSESQGQSNQPQQSMMKKRKHSKVRGPTLCRDLWDTHESEKIVVPVNKFGQPVGPEASKLSTFLGTVARNGEMTPLTYVNWSAMPDENKEEMWQFVQTKFHIDPIGKTWVMKSLASKWRNWKANLKAEYYYPYKTDEDRLKVRDERVLPDQWPILISYWNSEKVKLRSAKNKENRAKQKTVHTTGQKSYARIREEERAKRSDGKEPTRAELFIKTHTRKDGQPVNETTAEIIEKLREQEAQMPQTSHAGDDCDDAFFQVMGDEKCGHVRMYGLGPTPTDLWGQKLGRQNLGRIELMKIASEAKQSANDTVSKMLDKMEAMEQKYASMEAQIVRMTSSMQSFFDRMGEISKTSGGKQVSPKDSLHADAHSSSSGSAVPSNEAGREEV